MKALIYTGQDELKAWAAARIAHDMTWPGDTHAIGVTDDGVLRAVALFNLFLGTGCSVHIATDGSRAWASRPVLAGLFAYPFVQCGMRRLTVPIPARNRLSIILALKLGFSFEGRLRQAAANNDDEILMGMLRNECPWLPREAPDHEQG